jgi:hypothetical protein
MTMRTRGEDTPSESESSEEDEEVEEEEGEVTLPLHSLPCETLPSLGDIFHRQAGITVDACRLKWTWIENRSSTGSLPQPCLALVTPDSGG